jgi:hypothetical protein
MRSEHTSADDTYVAGIYNVVKMIKVRDTHNKPYALPSILDIHSDSLKLIRPDSTADLRRERAPCTALLVDDRRGVVTGTTLLADSASLSTGRKPGECSVDPSMPGDSFLSLSGFDDPPEAVEKAAEDRLRAGGDANEALEPFFK